MKFEEMPPTETEESPSTETKEDPLRSLFNLELINTAKEISEMNGMDAMKEMGRLIKEDPRKAEQISTMISVIEANNPDQSLKELFADPEKIKELMELEEEKE